MELLITFILGFFILAGALIAKLTKNSKFIEHISIAVAFGAMAALAALELLPEALENLGTDKVWVLILCVVLGVVILKILDLFVPDHHHHHHSHEECEEEHGCECNMGHIGVVSAIAVTLHNIIEGMAVYSVAAGSMKIGILMALGVGLHNIPMGMVICSTLSKEKTVKKVVFISLAALSTFVGGLLMMLLWTVISEFVIGILISLTLGMLIYIVLFELLPHLVYEKNVVLSVAGVLVGVVIILISCLLG